MPLIAWNDDLSLNLPEIDAHHQHLVELLNRAHDSFIWGLEPGELTQLVNKLQEYAAYHFTAEEALMQQANDPFLAPHVREHQAFCAKVAELDRIQNKDSYPAYLAVIDYLLEWLVNHIKTTDRTSLASLNHG